MKICGMLTNPDLLKSGVRDVGGAVPQRVAMTRFHAAHRLGNRASERAMLAWAVACVFADAARGPVHLTPIARGPLGIQVPRRLEATHGRALNDHAKRDADWTNRGLAHGPHETVKRSTQKDREPCFLVWGGCAPPVHKLLKPTNGPRLCPGTHDRLVLKAERNRPYIGK